MHFIAIFSVFRKIRYLFHELSPNAASLFSSNCGRRSEDDALLVLAEEFDEGICLKIKKKGNFEIEELENNNNSIAKCELKIKDCGLYLYNILD